MLILAGIVGFSGLIGGLIGGKNMAAFSVVVIGVVMIGGMSLTGQF